MENRVLSASADDNPITEQAEQVGTQGFSVLENQDFHRRIGGVLRAIHQSSEIPAQVGDSQSSVLCGTMLRKRQSFPT